MNSYVTDSYKCYESEQMFCTLVVHLQMNRERSQAVFADYVVQKTGNKSGAQKGAGRGRVLKMITNHAQVSTIPAYV